MTSRFRDSSQWSWVTTTFQGVPFQQNIARLTIAVVILHVRNRMPDIRRVLPKILDAISSIKPGDVIEIAG